MPAVDVLNVIRKRRHVAMRPLATVNVAVCFAILGTRAGRTALHCAVESHGKGTSTLPIDAMNTISLLVDHGANLNKPVGLRLLRHSYTHWVRFGPL